MIYTTVLILTICAPSGQCTDARVPLPGATWLQCVMSAPQAMDAARARMRDGDRIGGFRCEGGA